MNRKILKRLVAGLLILLLLLALTAWVILNWVMTRPTTYYPEIELGPVALRSWEEHDAIYGKAEFPVVLSIESASGSLAYIGALHTSDAAHPQLKRIEQVWEEFQPTVALCEGRSRMNRFAGRPDSGNLSESDLTRILAQKHGVPLFTLEPAYENEVQGLLDHFDAEMVATYLTLRGYTSEKGNQGSDPDVLARSILAKRTDVDGLRNTFSDLSALDVYWRKTFPNEPDWRSLPNTDSTPLLVQVGNVSRQVRGEHMVRSIVELVRRGERVLAVVGASHVIRQEPVLRTLLTEEDEPGQSGQQDRASANTTPSGELKVVNWNVLYGFNHQKSVEQGVDWIRQQMPDVVALQEMNQHTEADLQQLAQRWNHDASALLKETGFPTALTSSAPIQVVKRQVDGFHHGYLHARTHDIHFFVVHFWPDKDHEGEQVAGEIADLIEAGERVILLGDFNTHSRKDANWLATRSGVQPRFTVVDMMEHAGLIDLVARHDPDARYTCPSPITIPEWSKDREELETRRQRIDFIFSDAELAEQAIDCQVILDETVEQVSDHYPVIATFRRTR